jgi:solute carrier family 35, member E1
MEGENLTPANMFAVLSILGFLAITPVSLVIEPPKAAIAAWTAALAKG